MAADEIKIVASQIKRARMDNNIFLSGLQIDHCGDNFCIMRSVRPELFYDHYNVFPKVGE